MEEVCRRLREPALLFGGMQVICVGDFYQLSPVKNPEYGDSGDYAFESVVWQQLITHKKHLQEIVRQADQNLIKAINEAEKGTVSDESERLICDTANNKLTHPVHIYGENSMVYEHNFSEMEQSGKPLHYYQSKDWGRTKLFNKYTCPKTLVLCVGCPVIFNANVNKSVVNGTRGKVQKLEVDGPTVVLSNGSCVKVKQSVFTKFSKREGDIVATREQFPLLVGYAMTVNRCQGLTIPEVVIHCANMRFAGQVGVAMGRVKSLAGLQVLNFSKHRCPRHPACVENFFTQDGSVLRHDVACCRNVSEKLFDEPIKNYHLIVHYDYR